LKRRGAAPVVVFALVLGAVMALAVALGTEPVDLGRALGDPGSLDRLIVVGVRLPRVVLGAIAGGGLAVAGVAFQAILRNPLAEPYVLGVSGGAAFGATLVITVGSSFVSAASFAGASAVSLGAFAGGLGATALSYFLARAPGASASTSTARSDASILLAGVVINSIAASAITMVKTLVSASKSQELLLWLMGFLDVPSLASLVTVGALVAAGGLILAFDAGRYNLLALGDEAAEHLGVDVRALERRAFLACSLVVGAIVSVTGLIAFVGLIVPHALRRMYGPDTRLTLPTSFFAGGAMLVLCDLGARLCFRALRTEPPVGAVTALVGGPLFLVLLRQRRA
jgi:iron complex transport system permease protein